MAFGQRGRIVRHGRTIRYVFLISLTALACAWGVWFALRPHHKPASSLRTEDRAVADIRLNECIGRTAREVVQFLGLGEAAWFWTDEPPGILRGVSYFPADGRSVTIYIAQEEALFRRFDEHREWDYEGFLNCRVGGIQYAVGEARHDIGPAVPWQWRR
jgi:hypothetical protein